MPNYRKKTTIGAERVFLSENSRCLAGSCPRNCSLSGSEAMAARVQAPRSPGIFESAEPGDDGTPTSRGGRCPIENSDSARVSSRRKCAYLATTFTVWREPDKVPVLWMFTK